MNDKFKNFMKNFTDALSMIFGYTILIILLLGGLTFFAFLVALIIGGPAATAICSFIYKQFYPILVYTSTISLLFAMVIFYLKGNLSTKKKV